MAKLGGQLKNGSSQIRLTRSQRVAQKQAVQRDVLAKGRFEGLKAKAKKIQEEKFKDKVVTVDQAYKTYRPSNISARAWDRLSQSSKDRQMRRFTENNAYSLDKHVRKGNLVVHSTGTRKATKTIPFTLEDGENSYKSVYDNLSPDLKQFFDTPDTVLQQKAERIKTTKSKIQEKLSYADQKIQERKDYYAKKIQDRQTWWSNKPSSYRTKERKERHKETLNDYEDDLDEDIAKWRGYKEGLSKGSQQLDQNKDVTFSSLENYAWDVASYEEQREEARNNNRNSFNQSKRSGELNETFKQLGLKENTGYSTYSKAVKNYNKDVAYKQSLVKWADKVGFSKISPQAQAILNPSAVDWQKQNPTEKLIFDKLGNVTGVESGSLKQTLSIDNYQKVNSPDYIYAQWKKNNPAPKTPLRIDEALAQQSFAPDPIFPAKKDLYVPYKTLTAGKELPIGYGSQGTGIVDSKGDFIAPTLLMSEKDYYRKVDTLGIGSVWSGVKSGYNYLDENIHFTGEINRPIKFGKIEKVDAPIFDPNKLNVKVLTTKDLPIGYGSQQTTSTQGVNLLARTDIDTRTYEQKYGMTKPEMAVILGVNYLTKKGKNIESDVIGQEKIDKQKKDLEKKYQDIYQYEFEQRYMKDLIYGEINFDTASKEFSESNYTENLQKQYEKEYGVGYKELQKSPSFWSGTYAGVKQVGLGLGKFGLKTVGSPTRLAVTTGGLVTGTKVLGAIPQAVTLTATGGLFAYGSYKFLDPSSTYIERGSGLVTAVVSGATLGYAGVKYLKSPKVFRVGIKKPKMNLKSSGVIGKDLKLVKELSTKNKVVYEVAKGYQTSTKGYKTVVTTRGRLLANKFWKGIGVPAKFRTLESNAIYRGIPTQQLAKYQEVASGWQRILFGKGGSIGLKKVQVTKSGYQQATDLLKKYGWTSAQAKATLRYTAPRVYEGYQKGFIDITKGGKATGYFEQTIKRPVINLGGGVKTRGGSDLKYLTKVNRQLSKDVTGKIFAREQGYTISGFTDKAGNIKDWKNFELFSGKNYVLQSTKQKGFEYLGKKDGVEAWRENAKYKDIFSVSQKDPLKLKITKTAKNYHYDISYNPARKVNFQNQKLYDKIINLDKGKNVWVKPANIKKTPFSKTFGYGENAQKTGSVTIKGSKTSNVVKDIMKKIDKVDDFSTSGSPQVQSKYWGTGQYEQTSGGALTQKEILQNQNLLKTSFDTSFNAPTVKNAVLIKNAQLGSFKVGQFLSVGSVLDLKSNLKANLKANLKLNNQVKVGLKTDSLVKTEVKTVTKTSPALKSQLKSLLDVGTAPIGLNNPTFKTPKIRDPVIRTPKIPIALWLKAKKSKGSKKSKRDQNPLKLYLPDFTSRALGLDPIEIKGTKKLMAKINQIQTGLEIRRGIKVKY